MNVELSERLNSNEQKAIQTFLTRLRTHYPDRVFQAILFGSKARGDGQPDSDIDILLVVDSDKWRFQHAISDVASDVSLEYSVLIGPRVIGQANWKEMAQERFSLYENVAREAIRSRLNQSDPI
jgi:predicted nucleotidyltransferase